MMVPARINMPHAQVMIRMLQPENDCEDVDEVTESEITRHM